MSKYYKEGSTIHQKVLAVQDLMDELGLCFDTSGIVIVSNCGAVAKLVNMHGCSNSAGDELEALYRFPSEEWRLLYES